MFRPVPPAPAPPESQNDLGFGRVLSEDAGTRLLNPDGTFNVERFGLSPWERFSPYHALLTMSWGRFLAWMLAIYAGFNTLFAFAFLALGPAALDDPDAAVDGFWRAFDFSVQTFATIGYGRIAPASPLANALVVIESFFGFFAAALTTGIVFARFSRPRARVRFSRVAVLAPFREGEAFMFRAVNTRQSELIEVEAQAILAVFVDEGPRRVRRYFPLVLDRPRVTFFPLAWTVVHPLTPESPFARLGFDVLVAGDAEVLVLVKALDDASTQSVHARSSYHVADVQRGARFADIFERRGDRLGVDVSRLDATEPVGDAGP